MGPIARSTVVESFADEQVVHSSRQVLDIGQLVIDGVYECLNLRLGKRSKLKLMEVHDDYAVFRIQCGSSWGNTIRYFYTDISLMPYKNGQWNAYRYIVRVRSK